VILKKNEEEIQQAIAQRGVIAIAPEVNIFMSLSIKRLLIDW